MGFKSALKQGLGSGLNPKKWIGYSQIQADSRTVGKIFKSVFNRTKETKSKESFQEAMKRFNLTEEDIQKRIKSSKDLVMIFLGIGGALLLYTIYQWVGGHLLHGFICIILSSLTFAYAFREHFNLFQMRQRRLGCTYSEWFKSTFKRSK